jgi:peptidyl-prolyl cis-trans isomerase B (cyclophilin B)
MKRLLFVLGSAVFTAVMVISLASCGSRASEESAQNPMPDLTGSVEFMHKTGALANQLSPPASGEEYAVMITNYGEIHLRLFPDIAPLAVENFVTHARNGYYDGVIFHRVIDNFMIQGGDPTGTGTGGESIWGETFGNEFNTNLQHIRGALSMANRDNPALGVRNTNTSQFFIVQKSRLEPQEIADFEEILENRLNDPIPELNAVLGDIMPEEFIRHHITHGGTPHLDFRHTVFGQVFRGMEVVDSIAAAEVTDPINNNFKPIADVIIQTIEIRVME